MSTGRNEACPCGSGKKYKKCCAVSTQVAASVPKAPASKMPASLARDLNLLGQQLQMGLRQPFESGIKALVAKFPDCAPAWNLMGVGLQMFGGDGIPALQRAAELLPDSQDAQKNLGLALLKANRFGLAVDAFQRCVALGPTRAVDCNSLGAALLGCGRASDAQTWFERALELDPQARLSYLNLCRSLREQGKLELALEQASSAIDRLPQGSDLWQELSECLRAQGKLAEAVTAIEEALRLSPGQLHLLNNLAVLLAESGDWQRGESVLQGLIAHPDCSFDAVANLIEIQRHRGDHESALKSLEAVVSRFSNVAEAHHRLAQAYYSRGEINAAVRSMNLAKELAPDSGEIHSDYLFFKLHDPLASEFEVMDAFWEFGRKWGEGAEDLPRDDVRSDKRLRVGFVSGDFRNHAMMSFFGPLLTTMGQFADMELFGFYTHHELDEVSAATRSKFFSWHHVYGLNDAEFVSLVRKESIDILVDMSGHTGGNRLTAFARRPAPVQISCWGCPSTTGLAQMDYFLTDSYWLQPGTHEHQFSEKLCYLPTNSVFQPAVPSPEVSALPALKNGYLTLGSFNHPRKLSAMVFKQWGEVMKAIPTARLLAGGLDKGDNGQWLINAMQAEGVEAARVRVLSKMGLSAYLSTHHEVDFCLNGFPYTGGTTICHAIWMGIPTLTLAGDLPVTQTGPSILRQVGLADWVVRSESELVAKAVDVAHRLAELATTRAQLRQRFLDCNMGPKMAAEVAKNIHRAFRATWERHCKGLPPETLMVSGDTVSFLD